MLRLTPLHMGAPDGCVAFGATDDISFAREPPWSRRSIRSTRRLQTSYNRRRMAQPRRARPRPVRDHDLPPSRFRNELAFSGIREQDVLGMGRSEWTH